VKRHETTIPGCYVLEPYVSGDMRGTFVKMFREDWFRNLHLPIRYEEMFYTVSHERVLRGMHFQVPPHDHDKLVFCLSGCVLDVVVDLRVDTTSYGKHHILHLSADKPVALFIPRGLAHGFYVLQGPAVLCYWVTHGYVPEADQGIHWNSLGINWPDPEPVVSQRDNGLVQFEHFTSPFTWKLAEDR